MTRDRLPRKASLFMPHNPVAEPVPPAGTVTTPSKRPHYETEPTQDVTVRMTAREVMALDELAWEHRRATGRRVSRSELVRTLIDLLNTHPDLRTTILPHE
jgi:hypothetical protein